MKEQNKNIEVLLKMVRAGLWEKEAQFLYSSDIDFSEIYRLAEEQAVTGLVAAGIEHVTDVRVPQGTVLQFVTSALQLEQRNLAMNSFIANLIEEMRMQGIYAILVKGQGLAQCYERPLWRASGDVDLLLSHDNYQKTKDFLIPQASSVEMENEKALHCGMVLGQWVVELHGTLRSCCMPKMDKVIDEVQKDVFYNGNVRSWNNGNIQVFLPSVNNDVFFIFTHIIKHFFHGGMGLRQVCDWCRLLWKYQDSINVDLLERRLKAAGLMSEWKVFAVLAVESLGMPAEVIPLYTTSKNLKKKSGRVLSYMMEVGNLGNNRDKSFYATKSKVASKAISFRRHTSDTIRQLSIFPLDTLKVWFRMLFVGMVALFR